MHMWSAELARQQVVDDGVGLVGVEEELVRLRLGLVEWVVGIPEQRRSVVELGVR